MRIRLPLLATLPTAARLCAAWLYAAWLYAVLLYAVLLYAAPTAVFAQATPPAAALQSSSSSPTLTDAQREQEYHQIAQDVARMDRLLGLIKRVVTVVTPSVVHIEARPVRNSQVRSGVKEAGSGVIIRFQPGGTPYVLTNRHVIKKSSAPHIRIQFADGRVKNPTRIWSDPETDVAVMSINAKDLAPARIGDSNAVEIGDWVLAVGSPFGLSQSVTRGIISAKGRYNLDLGDGEVKYQNFLQTDAAINPGNSGGPLINMRGEVVGVNTAIASNSGGNEGIGFSIPVNVAIRIAEELANTGRVRRGFLGVTLDENFGKRSAVAVGLPRQFGARVEAVEPGSPADEAELSIDDVILSFGGVRVEDSEHLHSLVNLTEIGRGVELVVFRSGESVRRTVRIGDRASYYNTGR